ncbi:MAG: TonB-dependent receptor [Methylocystaceae bacterium]|nr:TonB-dependent receptor [Methylocystaceae bacterium]
MARRRKAKVSAIALVSMLASADAKAHTVSLPTIDVGGHRKIVSVPHKHLPKPKLPIVAQRLPSPVVALASPSPIDPNDGYQSSALQSTILGPRINYPRVPTNLDSSSERVFTGGQVNVLPAFRPGEALEVVPGLAVTQHSGEGKANQYYLRGFDLDHGTDLALYLDSMPLNMRTHGHGQGYADANFVMPELLETVDARKGPYNVEDGDFSNAGTIRMQYLHRVPEGVFTSTGGAFGYGRQFGMKSWSFANGDILGAGEVSIYNGPWTTPNKARKINGVLRYTQGEENNGLSIMGMAYANRWNSTDQIPLNLISSGQMSRWGTLNPKDGGETTRFSVSGHWAQETSTYKTRVEAFAMHSTLGLNNDFTYFLQYPDPWIGDQFRQFDRRTMIGANAYHTLKFDLLNKESELRFGFQSRYDDIRVGLGNEVSRQMFNIIRSDLVGEANTSLLTDFKTKWAPWLKTTVGARWDYYWGSNNGLQTYANSPVVGSPFAPNYNWAWDPNQPYHIWTAPFNNGATTSQLISPKGSVVINPWDNKTDFYMNFGRGFHSNDFRSTTQTYDTSELDSNYGYIPVKRQPLLSPSTGAEVGVKTKAVDGLESAATLFFMRTQTENIFEGDTGNTKIARGADRVGIEFTNHYRPISWAAFEADITATHARFRGYDWEQGLLYYSELLQPSAIPYGNFQGNGPGNYLINATPVVATGSMELGEAKGWFGAAKYRYIAPRALTQDGFFKSPAIGTVNLRAGYRWDEGWKLQLDVFNMLNSRSMQIAYAYGSLVGTNTLYSACAPLQKAPDAVCGGKAGGQTSVVGHPIEPPSWRLTFGGPLNFDANVNKRPDLLEPFTMLAKKDGEKTAQVANWTGPYLGLNLGGGSNTASNGNNLWFQDAVYGGVTKNANPNTTGGGLIAGGQAGYTYQLTPMFVVGLETDFQGTTMTGGVNGATYSALLNLNDQTGASYVPGYVNTGSKMVWFGTVRGRGGITIQPDLWLYGTGGFAYADVQQAAGYQNNSITQPIAADGALFALVQTIILTLIRRSLSSQSIDQ